MHNGTAPKTYVVLLNKDSIQAALAAARVPDSSMLYVEISCVRVLLLSQPADVSANSEREGSKLCIYISVISSDHARTSATSLI